MNVLIVNTFHYPRGGAPIYGFKLARLLGSRGHTAIPFAMHSPDNIPSPYARYFVEFIDFGHELERRSLKRAIRVFRRIFNYNEAAYRIGQLFDNVHIDVVHLNNFLHHITLSIVEPTKARNIPLVWSLHDHILVCPNTNLYNERAKKACTSCRSPMQRLLLPIFKRCKKRSLFASMMAAAEAIYFARRKTGNVPDFFIAPSEFLKKQHQRMGFDVSHFEIVPNFVDCAEFVPHTAPGEYALYLGRLSVEKGLDILIHAFSKMRDKRLVIAGSGPNELPLHKLADELHANVEFTGFKSGNELKQLIYGARLTILPSVCYENAPLSILESFAAGKPVLASNIGGIPEMVTEDTGVLFEPGNSDAIISAVESIYDKQATIEELGRNARKAAEEKYSPQNHIKKMVELYKRAQMQHC